MSSVARLPEFSMDQSTAKWVVARGRISNCPYGGNRFAAMIDFRSAVAPSLDRGGRDLVHAPSLQSAWGRLAPRLPDVHSRSLFALLAGSHPPARNFWTEFSVALGYSGLAMMGLQFGLTARFRYVTEPWGEDVIYHFHRQISLIAVGLVVAHPVILFVVKPELLAPSNMSTRR